MRLQAPSLRYRLAACLSLAGSLVCAADVAATPGQPQRLTAIEVGRDGLPFDIPAHAFVRLERSVLFPARSAQEGVELWASDGTAAGTRLVRDFCQASCDSDPRFLGASARQAFLSAMDDSGRRLLWATDGTAAGTVALMSNSRGVGDEGVFWAAGGRLLFSGFDSAGIEPWVSDGTPAGTRRLGDFGTERTTTYYSFRANQRAVFFLQSPFYGGPSTLFASDGTAAGTVALGTWERPYQNLGVTADHVFLLVGSSEPFDLWTSTGTAAGTRSLRNISPALGAAGSLDLLATTSRFALITAAKPSGERELWASDGTPAGTRRLLANAEVASVVTLDDPSGLSRPPQVPRGWALLLLRTTAGGEQLWATDGTPEGTRSLLDTCAASCLASVQHLGDLDAAVIFRRQATGRGQELWASDGTVAGTRRLDPGCGTGCQIEFSTGIGRLGNAFVVTSWQTDQPGLWLTDGTPGGTRPLTTAEVATTEKGAETPAGNLLFFGSSRDPAYAGLGELWEVRAIPAIAQPLRRIFDYETQSPELFSPTSVGETFVFTSRLPGGGATVWASRGTPETTGPLFTPEPAHEGTPVAAAPLGGRLLLTTSGDSGSALWSLDGTAAGTEVLARFGGGRTSCGLQALGNQTYFFVTPGRFDAVSDLWATDGTAAGTRLVAPGVGTAACLPAPVTTLGGDLLFLGAGGLYRSDTTATGTWRLRDYAADTFDTGHLLAVGDRAFFIAVPPGQRAPYLWVTDGTADGTQALAYAAVSGDFYHWLAAVDGLAYFQSFTSEEGLELWRTDGTPGGTYRIKDISPGPASSSASGLTRVGHRLFFRADDGLHGTELWVSDGSEEGTHLVRDIHAGPASSSPADFVAVEDRVVFRASDGIHGSELWTSDGTDAGTYPLSDLALGPPSSAASPLMTLGQRLYFAADDQQHGRQLWTLDLAEPPPCSATTDLCLRDGRVRLRVHWRDARSGNEGDGRAVPFSDRTGFFWFFASENLELVVKVLDGTAVNGHLWTFYGGLSDVEYWLEVTDLTTGASKTYHNPQREICGNGDTLSLPALAGTAVPVEPFGPAANTARTTGSCAGDARTLCLLGRFSVEVEWHDQRTGATGHGTAVPGSESSGTFSFFDPANLELVVKMLDGTPVNGHYWFFFGALSDVEYTLRVRDSATGTERTYSNPGGEICGQAHVDAFAE